MEVSCLTYLEYRAWKTFYTPLCALMLPYIVVLLVTIMIAGNFGFVAFNYDSLWVWICGLPLFAIPSFTASALLRRYNLPIRTRIQDNRQNIPTIIVAIGFIVITALLFKLYQTISYGFNLYGTEEFTEEFSGKGIWAHLREMIMPILILSLYYIKKKDYLLWLLILLMLIIQFSYMVKGAIIIAVVSALLMRLYSEKTHMNITLILGVVAGSILVFYIIYMIVPLLGNDGEANMNLAEFIARHFVHYFTSGTLGWSYDLDQGVPDQNNISYIFAPFVNIYNAITGSELISPVNHFYWNTGISYTNVRTFFGTIFIYTNAIEFITYTIVVSSFVYMWKFLSLVFNNIYIHTILFYYCGLLSMGWFEFYFFHLSVIEIPVFVLLYMWICGKEVSFGKC